MRFPSSTLLAGFLVACATGETPGDDINDMLSQTAGSSGSSNNTSGGAGGSGSTSGTGGGSAAGSFNSGGMPATGGTFVSGGTSFSGSTFTGGTAGAATGGGGATAGGSGGSGGNATAGSAGSGGKATGGTGGTGGTPATGCPAKTAWTATASIHAMDCTDPTSAYCGPPLRAIDGVSDNRYTTGTARTGAEWLQIDFGKEVTVSGLTLRTAAGSSDYTLAYAVRMSNNAADIGASAVIVSGAGMQGTTSVDFPAAKKGRYLRINQTMAMAGWWSVAELDVDCD